MLKALIVTDMHYTDIPLHIGRYHSLSPARLQEAFDNCLEEADIVINLGDTADDLEGGMDQKQALRDMAEIFNKIDKPYYTVIGNHDTAMDKHEFCKIIGMPHRYYSFNTDDYHCIVLDASMNSVDKPYPEKEMDWWISYIDREQIEWLKKEIDNADKDVLIFMHELLFLKDRTTVDDLIVINRDEILEVIENSSKVKAVISGHWHKGDLVAGDGRIPQITLNSMAEGTDTAYSLVTFDKNEITVKGFGRQPSFTVEI